MATVIGAGTTLAAPWLVQPILSVASRMGSFAPLDSGAPAAPLDPPEVREGLERVASALEGAVAGLTVTELRLGLGQTTEALQRALALGLRTKRLRRVGARNKLRYVLNA
ncbi:MAG TPA: hypothetical protein VGI39_25725 [Polyangiaceae bacterium]|jgi:hypothetical protein